MPPPNTSAKIKRYLCRQFGLPEDQVEMMLPGMKETLLKYMKNLEKTHQLGNSEALAEAAHTIKGAFLNLGLTDCADLALKIEDGAASADTSIDYTKLIDEMNGLVITIVNE